MSLRLLTAAACAALPLALAAPASAHHDPTASVTATSLSLGPTGCPSYERRPVSRCDGYRRATVTWSATCGARPFMSVEFWAARKGGGRPILIESDTAGEQLSGSASALVPPGSHLYATVTLECTWENTDLTGPEEHTVTRTSAPSPQVTVPPWLRQVSVQKGNYCNLNPGGRTVLQARQRGSIVSFSSDFVDRSLLGTGRRAPAAVRQRWLNAKGAGIRLRRRPEVFLLQEFGRREPFSGLLRPNPRRAGWLKLWEEVGGVRTNALAIKVLPNRC